MKQPSLPWNEIERLLKELIEYQQNKLLQSGQKQIPHITLDDLLQPNDFPTLENNPLFRYEEGILCGIQTVQMALQRAIKA